MQAYYGLFKIEAAPVHSFGLLLYGAQRVWIPSLRFLVPKPFRAEHIGTCGNKS